MTLSRRYFLAASASSGVALLLPKNFGGQPVKTFSGPMEQNAHQPVTLAPRPGARPSMTVLERDDLEHRIKCQCGCVLDVYTCRTTDFSCSVSPAMHSDVMALVDGGYSAPEILAAFQAVYGERVLMAPLRTGFNWVGYGLPFVVIGVGALGIASLIRRWRSPVAIAAAAPGNEITTHASPEEIALLDQRVRDVS